MAMLNLGMWDYRKRLEAERRVDELEEALEEANATIARLHDLVAKFQRGEVSTLYAEGHME
jgi:uncharacterized coiled-coil protein SlyX